MTDRAVVVIRFLFIGAWRERDAQQRRVPQHMQPRDHVLMPVVRKLDRELTLVLRLGRLIGVVGLAKGEAHSFARRGALVTDRADYRTRSAHRLARKKLRAMTAHAGIVIWEIGDVGKIALGIPGSRNLMTSIASERFVFLR